MIIREVSGSEEHFPESLLPNSHVGPRFAGEKSVVAIIQNYRWGFLVCSIEVGCLSHIDVTI
jgi:hypothetical protein